MWEKGYARDICKGLYDLVYECLRRDLSALLKEGQQRLTIPTVRKDLA